MTSINDQLGLWIPTLAPEALDPLHDVLGGLVSNLAEHDMASVQPKNGPEGKKDVKMVICFK